MNNEPPASGARGPFDADLRHAAGVVPVGPALPDSLAPLGGLLHEILARAGCNRLATAQRADDRLLDRMAAASRAAQDILLPGGQSLASRLWTSLASFSDGTMAEALREGRAGPGYLLVLATDASRRALYWQNARPLALARGVDGCLAAGGPYACLILCATDRMGALVAVRAHVQPVLSASWLLPVSTDEERDLLQVLLHLQERLDRFGWECTIMRRLAKGQVEPVIELAVAAPGSLEPRLLCLACAPAQESSQATGRLLADRASLTDGRFAQRLLAAVLAGRDP